MPRSLQIFFGSCVALAVGHATVYAQSNTTPVLYKLGGGSTYQAGCFDFCDCPLLQPIDMRGTFKLTLIDFNGLFWRYAVDDVRWRVDLGEPRLRISGSGTYRVGGEFASMHQLELDLVIDDEPVQHFDSGLVIGGGEFPRINIAVNMNDLFCYDILLEVRGRPFGDFDEDGDVDAADYAALQGCFGGPGGPPGSSSVYEPNCIEAFDGDGDNDVDLRDYAAFAQAYSAA